MSITKKLATSTGKIISKYMIKHNLRLNPDYSDKDIESLAILGCHMFIRICIWLISLFVIIKFFFYNLFNQLQLYDGQINSHLILAYTYIFVYWLFRRKFGGFHFNNEFICSLISTILPVLFSYISIIIFNINFLYIVLAYIFSYFTVFFIGVVDSTLKPLKPQHKANLKREGLIKLTLVLFLHVTIYFAGHLNCNKFLISISNVITLSVLSSFFNLYFGAYSRRKNKGVQQH